MAIIPKNGDLTAGVAGQRSAVISASPDPFITGDYPARASDIYPMSAALVLEAHTVVGFDSAKNLVAAEYMGLEGAKATGTLTLAGVAVAAETVTVGSTVYTFAAAPAAPYEVAPGASAAAAAANLEDAINGDLAGTPAHPDVTAVATGAAVAVTAKVGGTAGNAIASTETMTNGSFGAATLAGGAVDSAGVAPIGLVKYAYDNSAGAAGEQMAEVYRMGIFNPELMVWDASFDSDEKKRRAFEGAPSPTAIFIRKPTTMTVV